MLSITWGQVPEQGDPQPECRGEHRDQKPVFGEKLQEKVDFEDHKQIGPQHENGEKRQRKSTRKRSDEKVPPGIRKQHLVGQRLTAGTLLHVHERFERSKGHAEHEHHGEAGRRNVIERFSLPPCVQGTGQQQGAEDAGLQEDRSRIGPIEGQHEHQGDKQRQDPQRIGPQRRLARPDFSFERPIECKEAQPLHKGDCEQRQSGEVGCSTARCLCRFV